MPLYVFKCKHCGLVDELLLKVSELNSRQECSCGGDMRRLVTSSHFNMNPEKFGVYTNEGRFVEGHFEK